MAAGVNLYEEFIVRFNRLKDAAGGQPQRVLTFYKDSREIRDALRDLYMFLARTDLERRISESKLVIPRAPGFLTAWKEYEAKWRFEVSFPRYSLLADKQELWDDVEAEPPSCTASDEPKDPDPELDETFDPRWHDGGAAIDLGISSLEGEANSYDILGNQARLTVGAYDYLSNTIGLDMRKVFRRWRKVPVVFMPAHVANHYRDSDKGSLPDLLDDAVRAYVFGATAAAIAMCRATLETVLKRHYGHGQWGEKGLGELVALASYRFDFIQEGKIKPLVDAANRILHDYTRAASLTDEDDRTIISFLKTLKYLIERAPNLGAIQA